MSSATILRESYSGYMTLSNTLKQIPYKVSKMLRLSSKPTRELIFDALDEARSGKKCNIDLTLLNKSKGKCTQRSGVSYKAG